MSTATIEIKKQEVTEVTEKFRDSKSTVVVDYRGLTVDEVTQLRKELREAGVELRVYKNNITRRAAKEAGFEGLVEYLTGPNAVAFSNDDAIAPAKILHSFAKEHQALELKAGIVEGNTVATDELVALATLPSREGLLSMLLSVLQAPIRNMALATKAVAEQKEEQGE